MPSAMRADVEPISTMDVARATELLRQAAPFGDAVFRDVYTSLRTHHPGCVPEEMPARDDEAIFRAADVTLRRRVSPQPFRAVVPSSR